jgi:NAD(P)-dependent dehydrogenase (short-subunit alcohol dehydrogenase family)
MTQWALVTGSARRIGCAIALDLAAKGWDIIIHYNRSAEDAAKLAEEIAELGQKAVLAEIDLSNLDHVAKLIPSLSSELGALSALVNNASLFEPDHKDPDGHLHKAVNADAPRILSEAFYKQAQPGAAIVNLLDGMPPEKNLDAYNRSKATLKTDTLEMAKRFAPYVRVNGVAPGPILPNIRQSEQHFQKQVDDTLLKTSITPKDIAGAVHFLLTSPAITGEILHIDGGRHLQD